MYKFAILAALATMTASAQTTTTSTTTGATTSTTTGTKTTTSSTTSKKSGTKGTSTKTTAPKATTTRNTTTKTTTSDADIPAGERIKVVKSACSQLFVQTMFDDSIPVEQKVKTVEALATGVEKANREGVDDGVLRSALNILSTVDAQVVKNLPSYVSSVVAVCEEKDYYGSAALRQAVRRFVGSLSTR